MRLATLRRSRHQPPLPGLHGPARVERRAPATWPAGPAPATSRCSTTSTWTAPAPSCWSTPASAAVVNAAPSISGRYPNLGPAAARPGRHPGARPGRPRGHPARWTTATGCGSTATRSTAARSLVCRGELLTAAVGRAGDGGGPGRPRRPAAGLRARHDRAPAPRARPAARRHRRARASQTPIEGRAVVVVTRGKGSERGPARPALLAARHRAGPRRRRRGRRRAARRRAAPAPGRRRPAG